MYQQYGEQIKIRRKHVCCIFSCCIFKKIVILGTVNNNQICLNNSHYENKYLDRIQDRGLNTLQMCEQVCTSLPSVGPVGVYLIGVNEC